MQSPTMYLMSCFEAAWSCHFRKMQRQVRHKRELWGKVMKVNESCQ